MNVPAAVTEDNLFPHINAAQELKNIDGTPTPRLLELYNEITESSLKKFESRDIGKARTAKVLEQLAADQKALPTTSVVVKDKKKREMNFRFAPNMEEFVEPREGTIRCTIYKLIDTPEGATLEELITNLRTKKMNNLYECLRLLYFKNGIGMWHTTEGETLRVRAIKTKEEYIKLLNESKK